MSAIKLLGEMEQNMRAIRFLVPIAFAVLILLNISGVQASGNAAAQWQALPTKVLQCMEMAADSVGETTSQWISGGISPDDPRLSQAMQACEKYAAGLRQRFQCTLEDSAGRSISTICREYYVVYRNGGKQEVSSDEAIRLSFIEKEKVGLWNEELQEGVAARQNLTQKTVSGWGAQSDTGSKTAPSVTGWGAATPNALPVKEPGSPEKAIDASDDLPFSADWILGEWCYVDPVRPLADNPKLKPLLLSCTRDQGCNLLPNDKPWDKVSWTSTRLSSASYTASSYGEQLGRQLMNVPEGVDGATFECKVNRLGVSEINRVCDGGLYGEEKPGKLERYMRCDILEADVAAAKDKPSTAGNSATAPKPKPTPVIKIVAQKEYWGSFLCGDEIVTGNFREPGYGAWAVQAYLEIGADRNPYAASVFQERSALICFPTDWRRAGSDLTVVERINLGGIGGEVVKGDIVKIGDNLYGFINEFQMR